MLSCRESDIGMLLHAYELEALTEEETERFEIHVLSCNFCFRELADFEKAASYFHSDAEVHSIITNAARTAERSESRLRKLWKHLWPQAPLILKPAFAYLLIILMAYPTYWGLKSLREDEIRTVQAINLYATRSAGEKTFKIGSHSDGLLVFLYRGSVPGRSYEVTIMTDSGETVFRDNEFTDFDRHGTGRLLLPLREMDPDNYKLILRDPRAEPPQNVQEYHFRIEK
jgi:hypothetical protein